MIKTLRRYAAIALAGFGFSLPASANSFGIDFTDIWYNPSESGWGINLIHQHNIIFATLFVYGPDSNPTWYVASGMTGSGTSYSGTLYRLTGPAFTAPWTGASPPSAVGSISLSFPTVNTATLTYTVNGATVTKQIQRQSFAGNNVAGNYIGGFTGIATGCSSSGDNGAVLATGLFTAQHSNFQSGGNVTIRVDFRNAAGASHSCTYSGAYTPMGRLGQISGNYSCTAGPTSGTFTMTEVDVSRNGFNAGFFGRDNLGCNYGGFFGGVRDVI